MQTSQIYDDRILTGPGTSRKHMDAAGLTEKVLRKIPVPVVRNVLFSAQ
jgi:hypothetical protein